MSDGSLEDSPVRLPRVVDTAPLTLAVRWEHLRTTLVSIGDRVLSSAIFGAAIAGLLVPPVAFLVSGVWSAVVYISGVWTLWQEIKAWRIADMFSTLVAVDTSSRFALAGMSYFALVFSFIVLFAGLLGRRWQRMYLLPGMLLSVPTVVIFTFAATLSYSVLASRFHLPGWAQYPLTGYIFLNALVLAVLLLDLRPSTHRSWLARHRRRREPVVNYGDVSSKPLPVIRFGPAQPALESVSADAITEPTVLLESTAEVNAGEDAEPVVSHELATVINVIPSATHEQPEVLEATHMAGTPAESEAVAAIRTGTL